jgi:hypothetical protein
MAFLGAMQRAHGGFEPGVSEGARHETEVDAGFEPMGGVGMTEGMQRNAEFGHSGALVSVAEGALDSVSAHGLGSGSHVFVIAPGGGEEPGGMTVCGPGASQKNQRVLRQRDGTVLGALASVDMDHHALGIDIEDL